MGDTVKSNQCVSVLPLIVAWYAFSLHLYIAVKEALLIRPDAHILTAVQFIVAAVIGKILRSIKLIPEISIKSEDVKMHLLPISVFFYLGNLCTNCALGSISVGFTHILKTLEPLCAVVVARTVLGESPPSGSWFGLLTILCGVGTVIISDLNFSLVGMFFALTSNIFLPLRNVYSTALMGRDTATRISAFQLFFATTQLSALIACGMQLIQWIIISLMLPNKTPTIVSVINWDLLITGLSFMAMHSTSYIILERLQPISHALMNCFKRAFIIFGSALVLGTGLRTAQVVGIALALIGLYLYSQAKKGHSGVKSTQFSKIALFISIISLIISLKSASDRTFSPSSMVESGASFTIRLRRLTSNFGMLGEALPYVIRKAVVAHDLPDPLAPTIHYVWLHPVPMPDSALQNIADLASYANLIVHCGSEECEVQTEDMRNSGKAVTTRTLVAPEICQDTPLYRWTKRHVFYKLQAGSNYEKQLKQAIALCIMYQIGGIYVDDSVALTENLDLTKLPTGLWMSHQKGLFHVGYSPPKDDRLMKMMKNYVKNYPAWQHSGTIWPSVYDFTSLVETNEIKLEKVDVTAVGFITRQVTLPSNMRQYATLKYDLRRQKFLNLGDEVQSYVGIQFLPHIDHFLTRDLLHTYKFDNNVTFFINAWIGDGHFDWPYQPYMNPVMIAIHLAKPGYINSKRKTQYLKSKAPIGARDLKTLEKLQKMMIPSYFSGCATILTQNPYTRKEKDRTIYVVDVQPAHDVIMRVLPEEVREDIVYVSHDAESVNSTEFDNIGRFLYMADLILEKYAKARAIITQRLHVAMPCVGLGVPVIFFGNTENLPGGNPDRLTGLTDMWHFFDVKNENETQMKARMTELFANDGPHGNPNPKLQHQLKKNLFAHILSRHGPELRNAARMHGVIEKNAHFTPIDVTVMSKFPPPPFDPQSMNVSYKDTRPH